MFGLTVAEKRPWLEPAIGSLMQGFGLTAISNIVVAYVVDSYASLAAESTAVIFLIKGIIECIVTLYAEDWVAAAGTKQAFGQMVGIQYFVCIFAVVFFLWGKRMRALTVQYGPVKWRGPVS